jgi:hypothetical protein
LELFLLLISEAVLLIVALVAGVVPIIVIVVVLVEGVELLTFGAVSDEVSGVPTLKAAPR